MSRGDEVESRRAAHAEHILTAFSNARDNIAAEIEEGATVVAFVAIDACIGCDQCILVCDDKAIRLYDAPLRSEIDGIEVNKKAEILRDDCTGCRLCVLACPTNAISMIDR